MRIYKRNGIMYVDYMNNGKRIRKSTNLEYSESNIKLYKRMILNDIQNTSLFLNDLINEILEEKSLTLKETSIMTYESVSKTFIFPYFENKLITEIKAKHIKVWQLTLVSKNITTSTITFARTILNQTFNNAILNELIENNPLRAIKVLSNNSNYEINPFSLDEVKRILQHSKGQFKNLLGVAFFSGLRIGEVIGLKWSDIDFINKTISVKRTINKNHIQSPKTKSSIRTIDIIDACYQYLNNQQFYTKLNNDFVFVSSKSSHYSSSYNLRYSYKKILESACVEYRPIYHTRHTFASIMLNEGENLLWVSSMLGHKNSDVTLKKYSKYIKKEGVRRATFLDDWHNFGT